MTPHIELSLPLKRLALFGLTFGAALAHANSAPVALAPPDVSSYVMQISKMSSGDLCIVGQTMDPDGDLQAHGRVVVFSTAKNKILWQQTIDAPDDNAAIRMVACRADGKFIYVGANVDTHSERSLNQTLAYVYKFDSLGKQVAAKELVTGARNAMVYDLDVDDSGITVAGLTMNEKPAAKANGMYFAKLDASLKLSSLVKLPTGAYQNGAVVKLSGNVAVFGGNFLPADAKSAPVEDYAVSKIVAGKYQFSTRPQKAKPQQIATAIAAADDIVSLGYTGNASVLTVVGADGKATPPVAVKSALCQTEAMSADAETVYAVRRSCARPGDPAKLVTINRGSGVETLKAGIVGEPQFVFPLEGKVYVVSKKPDNSLLIQAVGKGA